MKKPPRIRKKKSKVFEEDAYIRYEDDEDEDEDQERSDGSNEFSEQSDEYNYELNAPENDFNIKSISERYVQPGIPELLPNLTNLDDLY